MTSEIMEAYFEKVVRKRCGAMFGKKALLIYDSASCHPDKCTDANVRVIKVSC